MKDYTYQIICKDPKGETNLFNVFHGTYTRQSWFKTLESAKRQCDRYVSWLKDIEYTDIRYRIYHRTQGVLETNTKVWEVR